MCECVEIVFFSSFEDLWPFGAALSTGGTCEQPVWTPQGTPNDLVICCDHIRGYPLENTPPLLEKNLHSDQLRRAPWKAFKEIRGSGEKKILQFGGGG